VQSTVFLRSRLYDGSTTHGIYSSIKVNILVILILHYRISISTVDIGHIGRTGVGDPQAFNSKGRGSGDQDYFYFYKIKYIDIDAPSHSYNIILIIIVVLVYI